MISEYHDLRDLCFLGHRKGFGRLEAVASLDAYQITNYQFFSKLIIFVAWFPKNSRKRFLNQEFHGQLPEKVWSKGLFDFSKSCPLGYHILFKWFHSERKCLLRQIHFQSNHQFFQDLRHSKFWKHFFFTHILLHWICSFFRCVYKIHDGKRRPKSLFISYKCLHQSKVYIFQ